jgi:hypothetical protein
MEAMEARDAPVPRRAPAGRSGGPREGGSAAADVEGPRSRPGICDGAPHENSSESGAARAAASRACVYFQLASVASSTTARGQQAREVPASRSATRSRARGAAGGSAADLARAVRPRIRPGDEATVLPRIWHRGLLAEPTTLPRPAPRETRRRSPVRSPLAGRRVSRAIRLSTRSMPLVLRAEPHHASAPAADYRRLPGAPPLHWGTWIGSDADEPNAAPRRSRALAARSGSGTATGVLPPRSACRRA